MVKLFGAKLRHLRRMQRLTQLELAGQLRGVTQSYISQLEAGQKEPSVQVALQVADVFGVTLDYLLRDSIPPLPTGEVTTGAENSAPVRDADEVLDETNNGDYTA